MMSPERRRESEEPDQNTPTQRPDSTGGSCLHQRRKTEQTAATPPVTLVRAAQTGNTGVNERGVGLSVTANELVKAEGEGGVAAVVVTLIHSLSSTGAEDA